MISRRWCRTFALAGLAAVASFSAASAQAGAGSAYQIPYRALVGVNPLGIPFEIFSIEAEGVVLPGVSLGGAGSYNAIRSDNGPGGRDPRFASGDVKVRYYPAEVALRGFAVGLALGVTKYSSIPEAPGSVRQSVTAPTISVLADYNFLLGARQRFVVGTGIGAKRLLASEEDRLLADAPRAYAFVRFVLGIAF